MHLDVVSFRIDRDGDDVVLWDDGAVERVLESNDFRRRKVGVIGDNDIGFDVRKGQVVVCQWFIVYGYKYVTMRLEGSYRSWVL